MRFPEGENVLNRVRLHLIQSAGAGPGLVSLTRGARGQLAGKGSSPSSPRSCPHLAKAEPAPMMIAGGTGHLRRRPTYRRVQETEARTPM